MANKLRLAFFQPDMPQNTGAAIRLCACLGVGLDIIEPCGFLWKEREFKRTAMDYYTAAAIIRHTGWEKFRSAYEGRRLVVMTTKAAMPYTDFAFRNDDILIAGRESAGVTDEVLTAADARIVIPMRPGLRSLNVVNASAMILGEALRQVLNGEKI